MERFHTQTNSRVRHGRRWKVDSKKALRPQWIWVRRSRSVGAEEELQLGPACSPHSQPLLSEMGESGHPHQPHPAPYHLAGPEASSAADLGSAVSEATDGRGQVERSCSFWSQKDLRLKRGENLPSWQQNRIYFYSVSRHV